MSLVVKCCRCGEEFTQELLRDHHERRCVKSHPISSLDPELETWAKSIREERAASVVIEKRAVVGLGKITRPGLTEMQDGAVYAWWGAVAGFACGVVVGIVLAVIGGVGLAAWYH